MRDVFMAAFPGVPTLGMTDETMALAVIERIENLRSTNIALATLVNTLRPPTHGQAQVVAVGGGIAGEQA